MAYYASYRNDRTFHSLLVFKMRFYATIRIGAVENTVGNVENSEIPAVENLTPSRLTPCKKVKQRERYSEKSSKNGRKREQ